MQYNQQYVLSTNSNQYIRMNEDRLGTPIFKAFNMSRAQYIQLARLYFGHTSFITSDVRDEFVKMTCAL